MFASLLRTHSCGCRQALRRMLDVAQASPLPGPHLLSHKEVGEQYIFLWRGWWGGGDCCPLPHSAKHHHCDRKASRAHACVALLCCIARSAVCGHDKSEVQQGPDRLCGQVDVRWFPRRHHHLLLFLFPPPTCIPPPPNNNQEQPRTATINHHYQPPPAVLQQQQWLDCMSCSMPIVCFVCRAMEDLIRIRCRYKYAPQNQTVVVKAEQAYGVVQYVRPTTEKSHALDAVWFCLSHANQRVHARACAPWALAGHCMRSMPL